jgi:hypothetical protein
MPKAIERLSHFETISNENLIKYIKGSPISLVSGKPIKFGSHEHQHQMRAIKKIMLKRKLQDHKAEKCVSFEDQREEAKASDIRKPRRSNIKSLVGHVEEAASHLKSPFKDPLQDIVSRASEPVPLRPFPPIPQEAIINSSNAMKSAESESIPTHLMHSFLPSQNKSFY